MHDVLFVFDVGIRASTLEKQSPNRVLHMSVRYELNCEGTRSHPHCHLPTRAHYKMRLHRGSTEHPAIQNFGASRKCGETRLRKNNVMRNVVKTVS